MCHLTNKIYREMLCPRLRDHQRITYIIIGPAGIDNVQATKAFESQSSWIPHGQHEIVLSWDVLAWISVEGRIPCSFTNFITIPEYSGDWYISPDIYHTQITEYSL